VAETSARLKSASGVEGRSDMIEKPLSPPEHNPGVIELIPMKDMGDCGVCCLAMLLGRSYKEITQHISPRSLKAAKREGITILHMCRIAGAFGVRLIYEDHPEDDSIGILKFNRIKGYDDAAHAAMYLKGVLYNPGDGLLYTDVDSFLRYGKWEIEGFLWRRQ